MKRVLVSISALALLAACSAEESSTGTEKAATQAATEESSPAEADNAAAPAPTAEEAEAFVDLAEKTLQEFAEYASRIAWVQANFITYDTNWLASKADAEGTELSVKFANGAKKFNDLDLPQDVRRKLEIIKLGVNLPAPERPGAAAELAEIKTRMESLYSTAKIELDGKQVPLNDLEEMMGTVKDPEKLKEIWTKWRDATKSMQADYARMVEIANEGARELGFADVGTMWRSRYEMDPDEFAAETDRLWNQVKPLYDALHCHVRAKLNEAYGEDAVPLDQPIRADLLGNMWAQSWLNVYDRVAPGTADVGYDVTDLLVKAGYTPKKMVETGEAFFSSLGFEPLPATFWERSLITKPADREVVCHASAWDLDDKDDIRIKMCTKVNADDFLTVHHELGHNYYQRAYKNHDWLFRGGANGGFHEAIGDMIGLSITPEYLKQIGLLGQVPDASKDIGLLMAQALDKIGFLPFGLLMDRWRWEVFSGRVTPDGYNEAWWELRRKYQGVRPPVERAADAFDPGAKYHIAASVSYTRYFIARILQFQFHQAACRMAGWNGPLHRCSIYGSREVGAKFRAMLEKGSAQPWPQTLKEFTGSEEMDGSAVVAYFAPLKAWLDEQNANRQCGWQ